MVGMLNYTALGDGLLDLLLAMNDGSLPNGLGSVSLLAEFICLFSNCSSSSSEPLTEPYGSSLNVANAKTRAFAYELFIPSAPRPAPKLPVKYPGSGSSAFYLSKKSYSNLGVVFYPLNLIALKLTLDLSSRSNSSLSSLIS